MNTLYTSLEEVRHHIDRLDSQLVTLIDQRTSYVAQATRAASHASPPLAT